MRASQADFILVGASLSHCLLAWFLKLRQPSLRVIILEREAQIPRHRTWSFHKADLGEDFASLEPLIVKTWPGHEVRLPHVYRVFEAEYCSMRPDHLQAKISEILGDDLRFSSGVEEVTAGTVKTTAGEILTGECVLQAQRPAIWPGPIGYQKFLGLHLRFENPHGLQRPILMDGCVEQKDGFRFFYLLPWSETELLVEATRYSSRPDLDADLFTSEIEDYVERAGWKIRSVEEREVGILPIPLQYDGFETVPEATIGATGGFFHPVTGYSLPTAVQIAERISSLSSFNCESVMSAIEAFRAERRSSLRFFCMLNRMMFRAAPPEERIKIFEHFYRLPESSVQRFYSGQLRVRDRIRLLSTSGRPPVSLTGWVQAGSTM
jgi:lycopene beta-cyclase